MSLSHALLVASLLPPVFPTLTATDVSQPVRTDMVVSAQWLESHLNDKNLVIVHVANDSSGYTKAHIPQARFLSWSSVATTRNGLANELPPVATLVKAVRELGIAQNSRVVLYDEAAGLQAARAYVALDYLGLGDNASLLDGHWKVWQSEKRPSDNQILKHVVTKFEPQLNLNVISALNQVEDIVWLKKNTSGSSIQLLDARPAAQFSGAEPGEGISRGGHLPGAVNIFWMDHVQSEARPLLKSVDELKALFAKQGLKPGQLIMTYCRTGGQASHSYFISRYLGYNTRLYDGSFSEWSASPERPVER